MNKCKKYLKNLVLDIYHELDEYEKADLEAHLHICPECRKEKQKLLKMTELMTLDTDMPDENTLKVLRNVTQIKIKQQQQRNISRSLVFRPGPVVQFAMVVIFIGIGFLAGKQYGLVKTNNLDQNTLNSLISAEQNIQYQDGEIMPYLTEISRLKYNPQTGKVDINYNTVNDIRLTADTGNPIVQDLLFYAMEENENPNVRMHAVKAVNDIAIKQKKLDDDYLSRLGAILEQEENPGIRLFSLRILESLPMNELVKNSLVHVLLYDSNTAMRIEALNILTKNKAAVKDIGKYLETASQDTNSYVRNQSNQFIKELKDQGPTKTTGPYELARRTQP